MSDPDGDAYERGEALEMMADEMEDLRKELEAAQAQVAVLMDGMEMAWGVIANAGRGDWTLEHPDWREAAANWRDKHWHPAVRSLAGVTAAHDARIWNQALEVAIEMAARAGANGAVSGAIRALRREPKP